MDAERLVEGSLRIGRDPSCSLDNTTPVVGHYHRGICHPRSFKVRPWLAQVNHKRMSPLRNSTASPLFVIHQLPLR